MSTDSTQQSGKCADRVANTILSPWRRNAAYARSLMAGIDGNMVVAQPSDDSPINHPAWILCHLNLYAGLCAALLQGESPADPIDHPHGKNSVLSSNGQDYPPLAEMTDEFARLHSAGTKALLTVTPELMDAPVPIERWQSKIGSIGEMMVTVMVKHESFHLGQLSAWRRAMGLPPVEM